MQKQMNQKRMENQTSNGPVLDFIMGKTDTAAAKRLTRNIRSVRSLWILARMKGAVDETGNWPQKREKTRKKA